MAETNLERLDRMFPGILLLSPAQTAQAMGGDRKKIYRLIDADKFPVEPRRIGGLIGIPKLALARWLDGDDMPTSKEKSSDAPVATPDPPKRGRGRPRGSTRMQKKKMVVISEFKSALAYEFEASEAKRTRDDLDGDVPPGKPPAPVQSSIEEPAPRQNAV